MGKGGSEAETLRNYQSRRAFLPKSEAGTDGWLHSDDACAGHGFLCKESDYYNVEAEKEGGVGGCYMQRKAMAALADLRDLLLLFFILSSSPSRFLCSFSGSHIHSMCYTQRNKTSDRIYIQRSVLLCRSVRLWAILSSSLLLLLLLSPSLQLYSSTVITSENYRGRARNIGSNHMTFSQNHGDDDDDDDDDQSGHSQISDSAQIMARSSALGSLRFQEAPSFHNGDGCPSPNGGFYVCDPSSVHIAMTLDGAYLRGTMAAVFSILQHASCPQNIVFHFLVTEEEEEEMAEMQEMQEMEELEATEDDHQNRNGRRRRRRRRRRRGRSHLVFHSLLHGSFPSLKFKIYDFNTSLVKDRISSSVREALEQPLNYGRNYLAEILEECVGRVIYLDSDVLLLDDIAELWATSLGQHTIAAPEYCHANFTKYFSPSFWEGEEAELWKRRRRRRRRRRSFHGGEREPCYFNTGVMVMDLRRWRSRNCTRRIEEWMEVQKERRIYELGSLPPFLLVFAGSVQPVAHRWNQHGLGGDSVTGSCRPLHPGPVSLLHWSGQGKPWSRLDSGRPCPLDRLWAPFDLHIAPAAPGPPS